MKVNLKSNLNRSLIEITIRNTINQIKDDPERSIRNLIDMAVTFSSGKFQKYFFGSAQTILKNENSCYYKLIPDLVNNVDTDRIVTFGMNVGYNSFAIGSKKIHETEAREHISVPWFVLLDLSGNDYLEHTDTYQKLIERGKELGIYTWLVYSPDNTNYILELAEAFPECAFVIFCPACEITSALLDEANTIYNIMFAVEYSDTTEAACTLLRSRNFLYSVYHPYSEQKTEAFMLDEILNDTENMHALFTMLFPHPYLFSESSSIYQHILQTRASQEYRTIPFDIVYDNSLINSFISEQGGLLAFVRNGIVRVRRACGVFTIPHL